MTHGPSCEGTAGGPWGVPPAFRPPSSAEVETLGHVYRGVDEALGREAAACRACGRCCAFQPGGLVLFASALEMAHLVAATDRPPEGRRVAQGPADGAWRCPYQTPPGEGVDGGLCTAREARPLGCRTYFCEPGAREAGERVHAAALEAIRRIGGAEGWYGPARVYLASLEA